MYNSNSMYMYVIWTLTSPLIVDVDSPSTAGGIWISVVRRSGEHLMRGREAATLSNWLDLTLNRWKGEIFTRDGSECVLDGLILLQRCRRYLLTTVNMHKLASNSQTTIVRKQYLFFKKEQINSCSTELDWASAEREQRDLYFESLLFLFVLEPLFSYINLGGLAQCVCLCFVTCA